MKFIYKNRLEHSTTAILLSMLMVFGSFLGIIGDALANGTGNFPAPTQGNWIISNTTVVWNESIFLTGDLIIQNGGNLTLSNVTLRMNLSSDGQFKIEVQSGGRLNIINNSNISSLNNNYHYNMYVKSGSTLLLQSSNFQNIGYSSGGSRGIKIETNEAMIKACTISSAYYGIWIKNVNASIYDNVISNSFLGIDLENSNSLLQNNTIINITNYGIYVHANSKSNITNTIISKALEGIHVEESSPLLQNTTIRNTTNGLFYGNSSGLNNTMDLFSDGNSTKTINFTHNGGNNSFARLSIPTGSTVTYASLNVTGNLSEDNGTWTQTEDSDYNSGMMDKVNATYNSLTLSEMNWQKGANNGNIIDLATGKFDSVHALDAVFTTSNTYGDYRLWYSGYDNSYASIGYATSTDPLSWTKQNSGNAVFTKSGVSGKFDQNGVRMGGIYNSSGNYSMYYYGLKTSGQWQIGRATTTNGISWVRQNSGNQVVSLGAYGAWDANHVLDPSLVYTGTQCQMYYSGQSGSPNYIFKIGKATSTYCNSNSWSKYASNPVLSNGASGKFDYGGALSPWVIKDGNTYKMWYAGINNSVYKIGYATSTDTNTWTRGNSGNPVLDLGTSGEFDDAGVTSPMVWKDGNYYRMTYAGYHNSHWTIGYAFSYDGITWYKMSNNGPVVLDVGMDGKFDSYTMAYPSLIKDGSTYKLWYSGFETGGSVYKIGYATSSDGFHWNRKNNGNAVLSNGAGSSWDYQGVYQPSIIKDGSTYKMWYAGKSGSTYRIGYATSSDGISWSKSNYNPIINCSGTGFFDSNSVFSPSVIKDGSTYKMWYTGYNGSTYTIGYAWSSDGINWTKYWANPVLTKSSNKFDSSYLAFPSVIKMNTYYYMTYAGYNGESLSSYKIGNAISLDGINWLKLNNGNEILSKGSSGKFDDTYIYNGPIITESDQIKLWYSAYDANVGTFKCRLGYAYASKYTNGTFISQAYTLGSTETISWEKIYWSSETPTGSAVKYRIRSATTSAGLSTASWYGPTSTTDFYTTNGSTINSIHANMTWIQFKLWMNSTNTNTPFINWVNLTYSDTRYPFNPSLDIGSDGEIDWYQSGLLTTTVRISGQSLANAINEANRYGINGYSYVTLQFSSSTAGKIMIDDIKIHSEQLYCNQINIINSSQIALYIINSKVNISDGTIENSSNKDISLTNGAILTLFDVFFNETKTFISSSNTVLIVQWPLSISVIDRKSNYINNYENTSLIIWSNDNYISDTKILVRDNSSNTLFNGISQPDGGITIPVTEYIQNSHGKEYLNGTPIHITITAFNQIRNITISSPITNPPHIKEVFNKTNLIISSIGTSREELSVSDGNVIINATIKNDGDINASGFVIQFYDGIHQIDQNYSIDSLVHDGSINVSANWNNWNSSYVGLHNISVKINTSQVGMEDVLGNNILQKEMTIYQTIINGPYTLSGSYNNQALLVIGNVTVSSNVFFNNSYLTIKGDKDGQYFLNVTSGGNFHVRNSIIRAANSTKRFNVTINGDMEIKNSTIMDVWAGLNYDQVLDHGPLGKFDSFGVWGPSVINDNGTLRMWYMGTNATRQNQKVGYALSSSGIEWTKQNNESPVFSYGSSGKFDSYKILNVSVVKKASTYHMWYAGMNTSNVSRIGYATSTDGINWTRQNNGNPVLDLGDSGKFDEKGVTNPFVIWDQIEQIYKMWYIGWNGTYYTGRVGYAFSTDGINWTRACNGNFVFNIGVSGKFDSETLTAVSIIKDENQHYHMWYSGRNSTNADAIGYATSPDGLFWIRQNNGNPVLDSEPGTWYFGCKFDHIFVTKPTVLLYGNSYRIWYSGYSNPGPYSRWLIGYAISQDRMNWNKLRNITGGFELNHEDITIDNVTLYNSQIGFVFKKNITRILNTRILTSIFDTILNNWINVTFNNVTLSKSRLYLKNNSVAQVSRNSVFEINDNSGLPISSTDVEVTDNNGNTKYSGTTDSNGLTPKLQLPIFFITSSQLTSSEPYFITIGIDTTKKMAVIIDIDITRIDNSNTDIHILTFNFYQKKWICTYGDAQHTNYYPITLRPNHASVLSIMQTYHSEQFDTNYKPDVLSPILVNRNKGVFITKNDVYTFEEKPVDQGHTFNKITPAHPPEMERYYDPYVYHVIYGKIDYLFSTGMYGTRDDTGDNVWKYHQVFWIELIDIDDGTSYGSMMIEPHLSYCDVLRDTSDTRTCTLSYGRYPTVESDRIYFITNIIGKNGQHTMLNSMPIFWIWGGSSIMDGQNNYYNGWTFRNWLFTYIDSDSLPNKGLFTAGPVIQRIKTTNILSDTDEANSYIFVTSVIQRTMGNIVVKNGAIIEIQENVRQEPLDPTEIDPTLGGKYTLSVKLLSTTNFMPSITGSMTLIKYPSISNLPNKLIIINDMVTKSTDNRLICLSSDDVTTQYWALTDSEVRYDTKSSFFYDNSQKLGKFATPAYNEYDRMIYITVNDKWGYTEDTLRISKITDMGDFEDSSIDFEFTYARMSGATSGQYQSVLNYDDDPIPITSFNDVLIYPDSTNGIFELSTDVTDGHDKLDFYHTLKGSNPGFESLVGGPPLVRPPGFSYTSDNQGRPCASVYYGTTYGELVTTTVCSV